jgi:uncharacterized YigZ family protein
MSRYPVPAKTIRIDYQMSNSRFLTTVGRASTVADARHFIKQIREDMPDASHHVYAFKVGYGANVTEGLSDDGEPTGTSGPPTLAVLRGADVGDVVLVTTRYFGGTKLGTGGLVYAYTNAAKEALAKLPLEEKVARRLVGISVEYSFYERLKQLSDQYDGLLEDDEFGADITRYMRLPEENLAPFADAIRELTAGQAEVVELDAL